MRKIRIPRQRATTHWTLAVALLVASLQASGAGTDGYAVYESRCAACHETAQERTPTRAVLESRTPEEVIRALTTGTMRAQAQGLTPGDIEAVAIFVTLKDLGLGAATPERNTCMKSDFHPATRGSQWNGWGRDLDNSHYQPRPGFTVRDLPRLELAWAYGYRGTRTYGQPTLAGNRLFVTSATGRVYALDPASGCTHWTFDAPVGVRSPVSVATRPGAGRAAAFFGDEAAQVYALDAGSGALLWKTRLDHHPSARITGAPVVHAGRLYVPVSSFEESVGRSASYACCSFRGSVAALDARTGQIIWQSHTIEQPPQPYRKNAAGVQLLGPAGGAVWSAPTLDPARGQLYVGTGNSYTDVPADAANAVLALDLMTGARRWVYQALAGDNFLMGCRVPGQGSCPEKIGPDLDFGSSPIRRTLRGGRQLVIAGQKSGDVYGFDPASGALVWRTKVGRGGPAGGIEWGPAADGDNVYVASADATFGMGEGTEGGLTALRLATGERLWHTPAPEARCSWGARNCSAAQSAAVSVMPGVVFSGSIDGHLRAYSTRDGAVLWDYDTARRYDTVNGVPATGGSLDGGSAVMAEGMLFVNSGYGRFIGQGGNVLLAFRVKRP